MKKKNVLLLVLESLTADEFDNDKYGEQAMPFLMKLKEKSLHADHFFSEGPHTEAGLHGIICRTNTLDYNAYLQRFSCNPEIIYDYFDRAGYDLYNMSWAGNYFPKRFDEKLQTFFMDGIEFPHILTWRIGFYHEVYERGELNEEDIKDLIDAYEDDFRICINFYKNVDVKPESYELVKERILKNPSELKEYVQALEVEYEIFKNAPQKYIIEDLKNGRVKDTLRERGFVQGNEVDYEKLKRIESKNKFFLNTLKRKQIISNLFDPNVLYLRLLRHTVKWLLKKPHMYMGHFYYRLQMSNQFDISKMKRFGLDCASLKKQFEYLACKLETANLSEKPWFFYTHPLSIHEPVEWFSYDKTEEEIQREINEAKRLLKHTKGYHGSYLYRLGMRYMDNCLRELFQNLKNKGLLDNTLIVITADHGTSQCSAPIRNSGFHNNCHSELYHIPFIIYENGVEGRSIEGKWENRDIIPTLLDICGIEGDDMLQGQSLVHPHEIRDIAHSERIGSGAPSLQHRDAIYVVWDENYKIEYEVKVYEEFEDGHLSAVYNLKEDPDEQCNIVKKHNKKDIIHLLEFARTRHFGLKKNYEIFLKNRIHG